VVPLHQSSPHLLDRSTGALLGLVLGDAMGSPGRGRPQGQVRGHFGWITDLLALPQGAGSVSAPTRAAFHLAAHWPETPEPPRRRRQHGRLRTSITAHHLLPLGITCRSVDQLAEQLTQLAPPRTTTSSLAGAALVTGIVSAAVEAPAEATDPAFLPAYLEMGFRAAEAVSGAGVPDAAASVIQRSLLAREIAVRAADDEDCLEQLYDLVGTSALAVESVPAAVGLLVRAEADPTHASVLAANLGGQASRIGALATAMAGAVRGCSAISTPWREHLETINTVCAEHVGARLLTQRA